MPDSTSIVPGATGAPPPPPVLDVPNKIPLRIPSVTMKDIFDYKDGERTTSPTRGRGAARSVSRDRKGHKLPLKLKLSHIMAFCFPEAENRRRNEKKEFQKRRLDSAVHTAIAGTVPEKIVRKTGALYNRVGRRSQSRSRSPSPRKTGSPGPTPAGSPPAGSPEEPATARTDASSPRTKSKEAKVAVFVRTREGPLKKGIKPKLNETGTLGARLPKRDRGKNAPKTNTSTLSLGLAAMKRADISLSPNDRSLSPTQLFSPKHVKVDNFYEPMIPDDSAIGRLDCIALFGPLETDGHLYGTMMIPGRGVHSVKDGQADLREGVGPHAATIYSKVQKAIDEQRLRKQGKKVKRSIFAFDENDSGSDGAEKRAGRQWAAGAVGGAGSDDTSSEEESRSVAWSSSLPRGGGGRKQGSKNTMSRGADERSASRSPRRGTTTQRRKGEGASDDSEDSDEAPRIVPANEMRKSDPETAEKIQEIMERGLMSPPSKTRTRERELHARMLKDLNLPKHDPLLLPTGERLRMHYSIGVVEQDRVLTDAQASERQHALLRTRSLLKTPKRTDSSSPEGLAAPERLGGVARSPSRGGVASVNLEDRTQLCCVQKRKLTQQEIFLMYLEYHRGQWKKALPAYGTEEEQTALIALTLGLLPETQFLDQDRASVSSGGSIGAGNLRNLGQKPGEKPDAHGGEWRDSWRTEGVYGAMIAANTGAENLETIIETRKQLRQKNVEQRRIDHTLRLNASIGQPTKIAGLIAKRQNPRTDLRLVTGALGGFAGGAEQVTHMRKRCIYSKADIICGPGKEHVICSVGRRGTRRNDRVSVSGEGGLC